MRDVGWAVALVAAAFAVIFFLSLISAENEARSYRRQVELCATTADNQSEFANCVEVVR